MSTNTSLVSGATSPLLLLSQDQAAKLSVAFKFAIIPCLSAVGICGNVMSMFLLTRQGFRKPSNVLIFGLALADVLFLAGLNNFARHVQASNVPVGYSFSENINYLFYIFYMMLLGAHYIGLFSSILITVLITVDRLLVIFLPLKVHTIVTPLRTLLVISCVVASIIGCFIYQYVLCFRFEQVHLVGGVVLGRIVRTERLYRDILSGAYSLFIETLNNLSGVVPMLLVTLGCAVIGIKATLIIRRRRELTSGGATPTYKPTSRHGMSKTSGGATPTYKPTSRHGMSKTSGGATSTYKPTSRHGMSKTTRTLVLICVLYILCNSFGFIFVYIMKIPALENEKYLLIVLDLFSTSSQCINSVGNFIIYVAANNNFTYKDFGKSFCAKNRRC